MTETISDRVIYLKEPLTFNGVTVTEFVVREPTNGAVERASAFLDGSMVGMRKYYSSLIKEVSGLSTQFVSILPYQSVREAQHYLDVFMDYSPPTTETSATS